MVSQDRVDLADFDARFLIMNPPSDADLIAGTVMTSMYYRVLVVLSAQVVSWCPPVVLTMCYFGEALKVVIPPSLMETTRRSHPELSYLVFGYSMEMSGIYDPFCNIRESDRPSQAVDTKGVQVTVAFANPIFFPADNTTVLVISQQTISSKPPRFQILNRHSLFHRYWTPYRSAIFPGCQSRFPCRRETFQRPRSSNQEGPCSRLR